MGALYTDGAIAKRCTLSRAGDYTNVLGHNSILQTNSNQRLALRHKLANLGCNYFC